MRTTWIQLYVYVMLLCMHTNLVFATQMADTVVVYKSERKLVLFSNGRIIRHYSISLGQNPIGHKQQLGDSRTPEGKYHIDYRNSKSRFFLSLHISYPNENDRARARRNGVNPGGDIFIHGLPNGQGSMSSLYKNIDWTDGCIAVSNRDMREIWRLVKNNTSIIINP